MLKVNFRYFVFKVVFHKKNLKFSKKTIFSLFPKKVKWPQMTSNLFLALFSQFFTKNSLGKVFFFRLNSNFLIFFSPWNFFHKFKKSHLKLSQNLITYPFTHNILCDSNIIIRRKILLWVLIIYFTQQRVVFFQFCALFFWQILQFCHFVVFQNFIIFIHFFDYYFLGTGYEIQLAL